MIDVVEDGPVEIVVHRSALLLLVVLEADEVHQLGGGLQIFVERDGERMRVGLRIGGRQVNGKRVKVEFYSR